MNEKCPLCNGKLMKLGNADNIQFVCSSCEYIKPIDEEYNYYETYTDKCQKCSHEITINPKDKKTTCSNCSCETIINIGLSHG